MAYTLNAHTAADTAHISVVIVQGEAVVTLRTRHGNVPVCAMRVPLHEWCEVIEQSRAKVRQATQKCGRDAPIVDGVTPSTQTEN